MNVSSTHSPYVSARPTWLRWIKGSGKQDIRREPAIRIDAEEFSDHMLRDIGFLDGRNSNGRRGKTDSLDGFLNDNPRRFL